MIHLSKSASPDLPISSSPHSPTSFIPTFLIILLYLLLTLGLTYPLPLNLANSVPSDIGDPLLNTWILAWDSHALLNNPLDLFNANIFYPLPNTLAYSEHLLSTALLILPLQLIFNEPVLAYNLSLLLSFLLAAVGMYLYMLRWTRNRYAAFIAGLIFGFAPYRFATIAHLQLLTFQWLPLALLFIDKLVARPSVTDRWPSQRGRRYWPQFRYSLALLIFLSLQILASWYLALYTGVILGLYLLLALLNRKIAPRHLPGLVGVLLLALGLALPFALPYLDLAAELRQARPLSLALSLAATPTDFLAAAPFNRLFGPLTHPFRERPNFTEENTLFIGFVAPLLTLTAIITLFISYAKKPSPHPPISPSPQRLLPTPYFLLLTSYSLLLLLLCLALTLPAPYAALANLIPATTIIRVPPRWIIPAFFALSILATLGYTLITRHHLLRFTFYVLRFKVSSHAILSLLTCFFLLLEALSIPLPLAHVENRADLNPAYQWLAAEAQVTDFALVELPLHSAPAPEYPEVKRLYASTLGWWQLINGYSGYTPARQPLLAQALATFPAEPAITTLQTLAAPSSMINDQLPITNYQFLSPHPPTSPSPYLPLYLLVHPGEAPLDRSQWETAGRWQAERNPALRPLGQFEGDYLYQVLPPDSQRFAAPPLATFGPDRAIQLLKIDFIPALAGSHPAQLALFWRAAAVPVADYILFIHLRAADGFVRGQADGPPVSNHYPTRLWQPDKIIQDIHPLPPEDFSRVDHLAIGLYNNATGERLPAFDINGERLADDALIIPMP